MRWMFVASAGEATVWDPSQLTSLAAWWDASDDTTVFDATTGGSLPADGASVARIEDKSGSGFHLTQGTSANRPVRQTAEQNSLDVLEFTRASETYLSRSTVPIAKNVGGLTIAAVYRENTAAGATHYIMHVARGTDNGARATLFLSPNENKLGSGGRRLDADAFIDAASAANALSNNQWYVGVAVHNFTGSELEVFANGTNVATNSSYHAGGNTSNTDASSIAIGTNTNATASFSLQGQVGEVVIVDAALSQTDREKLEGYLAHKWGLEAGLPVGHPYASAPPTV